MANSRLKATELIIVNCSRVSWRIRCLHGLVLFQRTAYRELELIIPDYADKPQQFIMGFLLFLYFWASLLPQLAVSFNFPCSLTTRVFFVFFFLPAQSNLQTHPSCSLPSSLAHTSVSLLNKTIPLSFPLFIKGNQPAIVHQRNLLKKTWPRMPPRQLTGNSLPMKRLPFM